jgi:hypothetical protein
MALRLPNSKKPIYFWRNQAWKKRLPESKLKILKMFYLTLATFYIMP